MSTAYMRMPIEVDGYTDSSFYAPREDDSDEPDHHRNAPVPSPECLYGLVGDIARAASATTEANAYAVALNVLVYLSVAVGRGPYMPVGNTWHHCNVFGMHIGRSGRGRKGDAASTVHRLDRAVRAHRDFAAPQVHRGGLSTREGLVLMIHDGYTEGKNEVEPIHDKRLMVFETEFVNVLQQAKRDGNTLSSALRDGWDGVSIKPATKSNRIGVTDPHIGIMGAITPSELRACIASRDLTNGFANRFMMIWAERPHMVPFPVAIPQSDVDALAARVIEVLEFSGAERHAEKDVLRMHLSDSARGLYEALYRRELNSDAGGPAIAPLLERRAPVLLRLAMIFALTDKSDEIHEQHLSSAHAWIRYWQDSVLYIFASANDEARAQEVSEAANKIVDFLRERTEASRWEVSKDCFSGHLSKAKIDAALDELLSATPPLIEIETRPRPGGFGSAATVKFYKLPAKLAKSAKLKETRGFAGDSTDAKSAKFAKSASAPTSQNAPTSQMDFAPPARIKPSTSPTSPTSQSLRKPDSATTEVDDGEAL